ncbi:MAG: PilZ domain-containing protein [Candidatus Firestonebacteria bacterium]
MGLENKRNYIRVRVSIPVEITESGGSALTVGRFVDFCAGGASIITSKCFPLGTKLLVTFEVEGEKYIQIASRVVRSRQNAEFCSLGIAFQNLTPVMSDRFDRLTRRLHSLKERGMRKGLI